MSSDISELFIHIRDTRLYERVIEQIMGMLRDGHLKPGQKLPPERIWVERLGVSRAVLREAFRVLESRGLVKVRHGDGRYLREMEPEYGTLSAQDPAEKLQKLAILDILETRKILEVESARLAALRATPEDLRNLESIHAALDEDLARYDEQSLGLQFHLAVAQASGNFMLRRLIAMQVELLRDLRQRQILGDVIWKDLNHQHGPIIDAIKDGDLDEARRLMGQHLDRLIEAVRGAEWTD